MCAVGDKKVIASATLSRPLGHVLVGVLLGVVALATHAATQTRTSSFSYDAATGLISKEVIEPGDSNLCLVTEYQHDAHGNKKNATTRSCNGSPGEAPAPSGDAVFSSRTSANAFDAGSVVIDTVTYSWSAGQFPTKSTNPLSQFETKQYDPRFGGVTQLTGPNTLATSWQYDDFGRKIRETRADGTYTTIAYALCSTIPGGTAACPTHGAMVVTVSVFGPDGSQAGPATKTYTDSLNREIRVETQGFDGTAIYKDTQYDARGRVLQVSKPYYVGQSALWTGFTHDDLNRVLTETAPVTVSGTRKTTIAYAGLVVTTTLSNADTGTNLPQGVTQTKTVTKNSQGQTREVKDTQNNTVSYQYDPFGNLLETNAGGVITTLEYDLRGRKKATNDPDMGRWEYRYNALGELIWQRDAKQQVSTMVYDLLGRMTSRSEVNLQSKWYYDTYKGGGACNKGIGKLCEAEADNGFRRTVAYDPLGRVSTLTTTIDATYTVRTDYVASGAHTGKVDTITYPTGFAVKHEYNARGYLLRLKNNADLLWQANTMDAQGHVTVELLGNGLTTSRGYDELDRLTQVTASASANTVQSMSFGYDTIGNLTSRTDAVTPVAESFIYDTLNRLRQASGSGLTTRSFDYNAIGNMTFKSDVGTYTYPAVNGTRPHAVTAITGGIAHGLTNPSFDYDANGNLQRVKSGTNDPCGATINPGERCLSYASFNLPDTVKGKDIAGNLYTYSYTYNAEHERVRLVTSRSTGTYTSIYVHPGGAAGALLYEKEIKPGNQIEHKHYVQGIGVYVTKSAYPTGDGPQMRYYHKDHLGSIVAITNATGTVIEKLAYEAYGKRRFPNGTADPNDTLFGVTTDRGFTAHEHLDELALIHMNGRIYDPLLGRFMTPDFIIQAPFDLQSYNRYSYGFNNPFAGSDPTGQIFGIDDLLFAVIVIGTAEIAKQTGLIDKQTFNLIAGVTVGWLLGGTGYALTSITEANVLIAGTAAGFVSSGGTFEGAIFGGITAGFFYGAGSIADSLGAAFAEGTLGRTALHAGVGCMMGAATGATCGRGAASAGFAEFIGGNLNIEYDLVARTVIGGTASVIAGDKFANGAITAAFGYLFNKCAHGNCWLNGKEYVSSYDPTTGRYVGYYEVTVERPTTARPTVEYGGGISEWWDYSVDALIEWVVKRPLPPLSVGVGFEAGAPFYQFEIGKQLFRYTVEGRAETRAPVDIEWGHGFVWKPSSLDPTVHQRPRMRLCTAADICTTN